MAQTIFPETGDAVTQAAWSALNDAVACDTGFVVSGYSLSDGGGLDVTVAAGSAFVNGFYISDDATTDVTLTDNTTNYVYLEPDGSLTDNTTGTNPGNAVLLGTVVTSGAAISSISHQVNVTTGRTIAIRKVSNESIASDTTLSDDAELIFAVGKRQIWEVDISLKIDFASAANFAWDLSVPSGSKFNTTYSFDGGTSYILSQTTDATGSTSLSTTGGSDYFKLNAVVWTGDTAGNVSIKWAQAISQVTSCVVFADSYLTARRVFG